MPVPDFIVDLRRKVGHAELWLPGVTAVVRRVDEILLVRRSDNGDWTPVTGIVDPGEQPATAARREVFEETGVTVEVDRLAWVNAHARRSTSTVTPVSSNTSRRAAVAGCSPGSTIPVTGVQSPLSDLLTSRISSTRRTTAVTPGSHSSAWPTLRRRSTMKSGTGMTRGYRWG